MSDFELLEAIGDIDVNLIEKCENDKIQPKKMTLLKFSVAACLCFIIIGAAITVEARRNGGVEIRTSEPQEPFYVNYVNYAEQPKGTLINEICLFENDFNSMTVQELLSYYSVQLNIEKVLPEMNLQNERRGVYRNEERGVYYDINRISYESEDGKLLSVTLGKKRWYPYIVPDENYGKLRQTDINGIGITVFGFSSEEYCAEFSGRGIFFRIGSKGLSQENFAACIKSVISDNHIEKNLKSADSLNTLTGTVCAVDSYANLINVKTDEGDGFTVYLPPKTAENIALNDKVAVVYKGNPITANTIWNQQFESISKK